MRAIFLVLFTLIASPAWVAGPPFAEFLAGSIAQGPFVPPDLSTPARAYSTRLRAAVRGPAIRAGIVPTGFTATSATTRLYVAQSSNVVQTLSGPMVACVPCNLTIGASDPTRSEGSDAFIVRQIDFSGACG